MEHAPFDYSGHPQLAQLWLAIVGNTPCYKPPMTGNGLHNLQKWSFGVWIIIVLPTNHCFCFKVKSTNHVRYLAASTGFVWTCHHVPINLGLWLLRSTFMLCNFWWIHIYIWPAKEFMFCRIRITTILSSDIHMLYHCFTVNPSLL
jgi:hypothetical protein